jgi:hypothetical protein
MDQRIISTRSDRYVNKTVSELHQANHSPIHGYQHVRVMALERAVERLVPVVEDINKYVDDAKRKCNRTSNLLTWDESAAIYLYTMSTPFFACLNDTLRAEQRYALKPWFAFLKLFMHALKKLPSSSLKVWRAVSGDIDSFVVNNNVIIWWSVNSCSTNLSVIQIYLHDRGIVFAIDAIDGKNISEYSAFPDEQEIILMPGTLLRSKSGPLNFMDRLRIVHLEEELRTEQEVEW